MKHTKHAWSRGAKQALVNILLLSQLFLGALAYAQGVNTTTVQGTVYLANGQPGSGTLEVSWPAFTTSSNQAVTAGKISLPIASDGFVSISLAPNAGATPAGQFYTALYHMSDGTTSTEYWTVPAGIKVSLGQVRAQVMPAAQAVQAVSKSYVDQAITSALGSQITASGGALTGPLYLNGDPTQPLQAATKHYVDTVGATSVPLAGGAMSGALSAPKVNGVNAPASGSGQTTLQVTVNAAGASGSVQIPGEYAGADTFSNPNGVRVEDLRTSGAQQNERSVKEFGAVCDGATDDTRALQAALDYAYTHGVALSIPQGICRTHALRWRGGTIGGLGRQVSALKGYPGEDVLATVADETGFAAHAKVHDMTIYVDQSVDASCAAAKGRAGAGGCTLNRPVASNSIFSTGGNGLTGVTGSGAGWYVGNCAIAMPAKTGSGGNGLQYAEISNLTISVTGDDPLAQYAGAHSTHTCGLYLAQWPKGSEFRDIDIGGVNTGIALPALPVARPEGLSADSNRWVDITLETAHGFVASAGSNNVLDGVVVRAENSAATAETPTGIVLDLREGEQGWTIRDSLVTPLWRATAPQLVVSAAGGGVASVAVGSDKGSGYDPYGATVPVKFSGGCTAQATATVNSDGSIAAVSVMQNGVGCSGTTTASLDVDGVWDTAAAVNLLSGKAVTVLGGNLLQGNGGYTVWSATESQSLANNWGGGGALPGGGGSYPSLVVSGDLGSTSQVAQFAGADFGEKLQKCVDLLSTSYGGACDARNYTGQLSMANDVAIASSNAMILMPCATISTAKQVRVKAGVRNVSIRGCAMRGGSEADGAKGGTAIQYSGAGAAIQVGDSAYAVNTPGFHLENVVINTTGSSLQTTQGFVAYRTQELKLESVYFLGNQSQTGMTLDGTGNYTGGSFYDVTLNGYGVGVNATGHQVSNAATTDWMNASVFVRTHIVCPTSNGAPTSGTIGINLQQGDGNTFTGGDVEGCATVLHLGSNAKNNTIVGLRNENSTTQVVADAGSAYNNWMSGGTLFTGQLVDNGTRNSFLDTFHRSFNGMNGDWYGSQQDATVTNHYRLGTGAGNERGLLERYQTDYGYRWTMGLSDATAGEQFYQVKDELNNVNRISIGQYNADQTNTNHQTVINSAGAGAIVLNGTSNAGTGGVVIGSGGVSSATVATISGAGNAQFTGNLQVGGTSTFTGSTTVRNNADAEIDHFLWAGKTAEQKESLIYKDYTGASQWYMVKDASNNWALNSATGGLDSIKAYQSTNSGDTYINAAKSSGAVRVNYENGSGTTFNVYGGNSSTLYASFAGAAAIKYPGLAASSGHSCLQIDSSGWVTNTGATCGTGSGSGTVASGTLGQIAYYSDNGAQVAGISAVPLTAGGTGSSTAAGALANLGALPLSGGTLTGTLAAPVFTGTGAEPQFSGTATHAQNLPTDFSVQSAGNPQSGTFNTINSASANVSGTLTANTVAAGTTILGVRTVAANDTATSSDYLIRCSGTITETLPATPGNSGSRGQIVVIKNVGTDSITISGNGRLIDGLTTYVLGTSFGNYPSITLQYDPTSETWNII